jgi:hypothetical protein
MQVVSSQYKGRLSIWDSTCNAFALNFLLFSQQCRHKQLIESSRIIPGKLTVPQQVKKFAFSYWDHTSSHGHATGLWPVQDEFTLHPYVISLISVLFASFHLCLDLSDGSSGIAFILTFPFVLQVSLISSSLNWSLCYYLITSRHYEVPYCAIFSILVLLPPSWVQIFSWQLPIIKYLRCIYFPLVERPSFTPTQNSS